MDYICFTIISYEESRGVSISNSILRQESNPAIMLLSFDRLALSALLAHTSIVLAQPTRSETNAPSKTKRAEGETFTFVGSETGDTYYA
jgi:hypothetical protein